MLVATFGKMPRFFWFFLPLASSSSSPVPSPLPMLALLASPGKYGKWGKENLLEELSSPGLGLCQYCHSSTHYNPQSRNEPKTISKTTSVFAVLVYGCLSSGHKITRLGRNDNHMDDIVWECRSKTCL